MNRKVVVRGDVPQGDFRQEESSLASVQSLNTRGRTSIPVGALEDGRYLGTVVNPKTLRPYWAFKVKERTVVLLVPDTRQAIVVGEGYLESGRSGYGRLASELGYPRVHTPTGVSERKSGLGVTLYTACALLASWCCENRKGALATQGMGISSLSDHSTSAHALWEAMYENNLVARFEGMEDPEGERNESDETHEDDLVDEVSFTVDGEYGTAHWSGSKDVGRSVIAEAEEEARRWFRRHNIEPDYEGKPSLENRDFKVKTSFEGAELEYTPDDFEDSFRNVTFQDLIDRAIEDWKRALKEESETEWKAVEDDEEAEKHAEAAADEWAERLRDNGTFHVTVTADYNISYSYTETAEADPDTVTGYTYKFDDAWNAGFILHSVLDETADMELPEAARASLLKLDLSEVKDPKAVALFYAMAAEAGLTWTELNRMRNRTEASRSYMQTLEVPSVEEALADVGTSFAEHGVVYVNPNDAEEAPGARAIFGDLVDLP